MVILNATKDLAPNITVEVRIVGIKQWKARLWVAKQFLKIAARIANVNIKFENYLYSKADFEG